ncbi:MAG: TonB-dependent receptor [Tannerellaceae bacterium]|jgi:TonB-linked SusC/RagA family outer membrane protein|nr:TonB-dependent receptor [Tannerellaceae bacterium]
MERHFNFMKFNWLTLFLLLCCVHLYAQEQRVTVNLQNASLKEVFNLIEEQTTYRFSYRNIMIDSLRNISIFQPDASVQSVLDKALEGRNLVYSIVSAKSIVIADRQKSLPEDVGVKKITGRVEGENGELIIGASVVIDGTATGTVTDMNGNYFLENVPADATLVFSYLGMKPRKLRIAGKTNINVRLEEDAISLDEVVSIGYGTQSKRFVSGSISSVKVAEAGRDLPNTNIAQSLGSVPGILFIGDGRPGQDGTLLIRGQNSLSGGNTPLIVLDGVIFQGSLSDINPQDIETVDVLKDASSATVYGSKAANGVILIQTKKGTAEKPAVRVGFFTAASNPGNQLKLLSPERYVERKLNWREQQGLEAVPANAADYLTVSEAGNYANGISRNAWDVISQNARMNTVDISISANTKYITCYLSGSYTDDKGLIYNDNQSRTTFRANVGSRIADWLSVGLDATYSNRDLSGKEASVSDAYRASPYSTFYHPDGDPAQYSVEEEQAGTNPLYSAMLTGNEEISENLFGNLYLDIGIPFIKGLNLRVNYSPNVRWRHNYNYVRQDKYRDNNMTGASKFNQREFMWECENILTWKKTVGEDHSLDLTFLYSRNHSGFESVTASAERLNVEGLGYNALQFGSTLTNTSNAYVTEGISYMGRVNYRLKNRYLLTFTTRRDGSSVFAKNNKYATFPSGSLAWILSEESFMKKFRFIDLLKLRASYGSVGNQAISPYQSLGLSDMTRYVFGDGGATSIGIVTSTLGNENLRWENTASQNIAVDFELFNNRFGGTLEFYNSDTKDLLVERSIPVMNGYTSIFSNIGQTNNRGIEIALHSVNSKSPDFRWSSDFSLTYNRNKIVHLYGQDLNNDGKEDDDIENNWFIGKPINSYYDYVYDGIYQENDTDIPAGSKPGFVRVKDMDNNGIIDSKDRTVVGSGGVPEYQMYLRNNFEYKNFSLSVSLISMLNWNAKFNLINPLAPGRSFGSIDVGWWTKENKSTTRPSLDYSNPLKTSWYSSRDFLRVKDVALAYEFDRTFLDKIHISGLRVYVSAKNVVTLTNWLGADPENGGDYADEQGYDMSFPMPRTYAVGMNISF